MGNMRSAEAYAALVDAAQAQQARLGPPAADRWAARAAAFRLDPRRELDANTAAIAAMIGPKDSVIDIGGGAGRVGLPIALRCRELLNVEPSAAMRGEFQASAAAAGIGNARCLAGGWPEGGAGLDADVVMLANVTYFVRDIVPFIEALQRAARRKVVIALWSVPPPNHPAMLFELLHGEPQAPAPTHRELLAVLWDLGFLPDVKVLPGAFRGSGEHPPTRPDAVRFAVERGSAKHIEGAADVVDAHFDELFDSSPRGYLPKWTPPARELLITWNNG